VSIGVNLWINLFRLFCVSGGSVALILEGGKMRPDYAAVMVVSAVTGKWELLSVKGRVVVFDTAQVAWEWLPTLGQGRISLTNEKGLSLCFAEISRTLPNRARVVSPYFPQETQPWRKHLIWSEMDA